MKLNSAATWDLLFIIFTVSLASWKPLPHCTSPYQHCLTSTGTKLVTETVPQFSLKLAYTQPCGHGNTHTHTGNPGVTAVVWPCPLLWGSGEGRSFSSALWNVNRCRFSWNYITSRSIGWQRAAQIDLMTEDRRDIAEDIHTCLLYCVKLTSAPALTERFYTVHYNHLYKKNRIVSTHRSLDINTQYLCFHSKTLHLKEWQTF